MPETIRTILEELYALEPELKAREAELAHLIFKLIQLRPDIKPSPSFVWELKLKLAQKEKELMSKNSQPVSSLDAITKIFSFLRQPYILTGAAIAIFALVLVSSLPGALRRIGQQPGQFTAGVVRLQPGAFGSLSAATGTAVTSLGGARPESATSHQAPASAARVFAKQSVAAGLGGGAVIDRPIMYQPYSYRYTGEPMTDLPAQVEVLRRIKNIGLPINDAFLKSFALGNLKLDSFSSANLSQVTLVEDKEFGYTVSVDFLEGAVNIFENWRRWPNPYNDCRDDACYQSLRIDINSIPADETLIAMANAWLTEHGISMENYGKPYIQDEWRVYYEQTPNKAQAYVPDVITIIYPLQVNGQPVYEFGGTPAGLSVNFNVRYSRVSGVWNLISQRYEASAYTAETDFNTLLKYATASQSNYPVPLMYAAPGPNGEAGAVELELGTPTAGYLRYWNYANNENQELFLPALVFPILNPPSATYSYLPKQVVVPLVKEFLQTGYSGDGPVKILPAEPMPEPGAAGSGSASAGTTVVEPVPAVLPPQ
jgi:hypothetical protein